MTVADLEGLWHREFMETPGLGIDRTTYVTWLQAGRFFCDLRQPADLACFRDVRCLRELSVEQLRELARQEGFAGALTLDGDIAEWHRQIDFQPGSGIADRARVVPDGAALMEYGTERPYVERWLREHVPPTTAWGARYVDPSRGCTAILVHAGNYLMIARDRRVAVAPGGTLAAHLDVSGTLEKQQDLLDLEISLGRLEANGEWRIERSSLPFKVGRSWRVSASPAPPDLLQMEDLTDDGRFVTRLWQRVTSL
jgi:hypothetical protein